MMRAKLIWLSLALYLAISLSATSAFAACTSPSGNAGDITFSSTMGIMAYCNGTGWIAMGVSSAYTFGTVTTGDFCSATSGTVISCTTSAQGSGQVVLATSPSIATPTLTGTVTLSGLTTAGPVLTTAAGVLSSIATLSGTYGGTGVNNGSNTITVGGNLTTAGALSLPTVTTGNVLYGSAANTLSALAIGTTGQVLTVSAGGLPVWTNPASGGLSSTLATNDIFVGNGSSVATAVALAGDCTLTYAGGINCTKTNGTLFGSLATLSAAPAGTLTGTTLASNVTGSSLTGVGTITSGVWNGSGIGIGYGGTNATSQSPNGVNYFNGTSITSGSGFVYSGTQVGIGTSTQTAALTLLGTEAMQFGTNVTTTGASVVDVPVGSGSSIRYTGGNTATFNGIAAGANGQIVYLHNGSTYALTLANLNTSPEATAANEIVTGTGSNLTVAANSAVILQYDSTATNSGGATGAWRVIGGSGSAGSSTLAGLTDVSISTASLSSGNLLQYNGAKWANVSIGSAVAAAIAPSVYVQHLASQSVTSGVPSKIQYDTVNYDTNNNWSNSNTRYTPTIAGKYIVSATTYCGNTALAYCSTQIYKNGTEAFQGSSYATAQAAESTVTGLIDMNGTTDYIEIYTLQGLSTLSGNADTRMTAALVAPLASGSVAGTGTANYIPMWSSSTNLTNSALYQSGGNVGIGTTVPMTSFHVYSNTSAGGITLDGSNNPAFGLFGNSVVKGFVGIATSSGAFDPASATGDIVFRTTGGAIRFNTNSGTGTSPLTILGSNGNVGIGTTAPIQPLHVNGVAVVAGNNANLGANGGPTTALENTGDLLIGWNMSNAGGETDFFANRGGGNVGGFRFTITPTQVFPLL